jgi:S-DNA-T family DNA segregation ATPase FtsK/SpoIIIE
MAKRKIKKDDKKANGFSVELTGLILILIGVIGFGFGYIGVLFKKFSMFLAGNWWFIILISLIIIGAYMLIKRQMPNFHSSRLIGLYVLFLVLLINSHYSFLNLEGTPKAILTATYNNYMARMDTISASTALDNIGSTSIAIGGGFTGALFISLFASLFGPTGTKIVLVMLTIFGFILTFNVTFADILEKIKKFWKKLPTEEPQEEKKIIVNDDGVVYDNHENKEEKKDNKVIITSIEDLKKNEIKTEEKPIEPTYEDEKSDEYRLPSINLLDPIKIKKDPNLMGTTRANQETLERVLKDFDIDAQVVEIHIGPAVTEYEITVPNGTKVNRILSINKEMALALGAKDVRIQAPIPGKKAIGIEIPNATISPVQFREIFESTENIPTQNKILVCLGKDIMGTPINTDITKMPHLLVAGSTGSGKSVCINSMIGSILMRYKPNEVKLVLVDPKKVELSNYNGTPHLLCPVVTDPKKASITLQKIVTEMEKRYQTFADKEFKNIAGYNEWIDKENKKHPETPLAKMPYIVVIIDELADLMLVASKEVEDSITRITQMARAAGIHLIVATQRPSTDVITGLVKNNIPSRISFAVSSQIDSRTILDQGGAEKLLGKGDMLFFPMGDSAPTRIQGCFISDAEIERLINFCKKQTTVKYDETITNDSPTSSSGVGFEGNDNPDDEMYNEVVEFAISTGKISASLIQRRFRFGYNRAARMMDLLEERGIVGPQNGSKPREVLVKLQSEEDKDE